jgi:hypothetical protein
MCAGEFPGDAPQKTQILILGELGASEERALVVSKRTWFSFEGPWRGVESSGVEERIETAGEAPPDAMLKGSLIELIEMNWLESQKRSLEEGNWKFSFELLRNSH